MNNNVIRFPARPRVVKRPISNVEEDASARWERHYKWHQWKDAVRHWGGGHRKRGGGNPNAIAVFNIHKTQWADRAYQQLMGTLVFKVLLEADRIACDPGRVSDRMLTRTLNLHVNFRRYDHAPVHPPVWLLEEIRLLAMQRWREVENGIVSGVTS